MQLMYLRMQDVHGTHVSYHIYTSKCPFGEAAVPSLPLIKAGAYSCYSWFSAPPPLCEQNLFLQQIHRAYIIYGRRKGNTQK